MLRNSRRSSILAFILALLSLPLSYPIFIILIITNAEKLSLIMILGMMNALGMLQE
jgi:hypothetical protein